MLLPVTFDPPAAPVSVGVVFAVELLAAGLLAAGLSEAVLAGDGLLLPGPAAPVVFDPLEHPVAARATKTMLTAANRVDVRLRRFRCSLSTP